MLAAGFQAMGKWCLLYNSFNFFVYLKFLIIQSKSGFWMVGILKEKSQFLSLHIINCCPELQCRAQKHSNSLMKWQVLIESCQLHFKCQSYRSLIQESRQLTIQSFHKYLRKSNFSRKIIKNKVSRYLFCLARISSSILLQLLSSLLAGRYV